MSNYGWQSGTGCVWIERRHLRHTEPWIIKAHICGEPSYGDFCGSAELTAEQAKEYAAELLEAANRLERANND